MKKFFGGARFFGMRTFVFLFVVVTFFRFLLNWNLLRPATTCFLIVFFTVFQGFFLVAISFNSGAPWTSNSNRFYCWHHTHNQSTEATTSLFVMSWEVRHGRLIMIVRLHNPNRKTFQVLKSKQFFLLLLEWYKSTGFGSAGFLFTKSFCNLSC